MSSPEARNLPEQVQNAEIENQWPSRLLVPDARGMCAGVVRSIEGYQAKLDEHPGQTVYSIGEPAHNTHVIEKFRQQGMEFVVSVDEVPEGAPAIQGPHGHTQEDIDMARERKLIYTPTECPLVTKVKDEIADYTEEGYTTILFGKKGHEETRAHMSAGKTILVNSEEEAFSDEILTLIEDPEKVAFATQTTHNADEAMRIAERLKAEHFPNLRIPRKEDICYATKHRQDAVKALIESGAQKIVVVGSKHSSNSWNLFGVALENGVSAEFIDGVEEFEEGKFFGFETVGLTSGASVMEETFAAVVEEFTKRGSSEPETIAVADESKIHFKPTQVIDFSSIT